MCKLETTTPERAFASAGRRVTALLLCLALLCLTARPARASGAGVIVVEAATGRVVYEDNADERMPMASTTKIMTALLTLEAGNLDEWFKVDDKAILVEGSSMGLKVGDQATLRALCVGMLLSSGNDAANAAAVRVAGSIDKFVERMNARAAELGMTNTSFETPSGLDGERHYSTARDMAILTAAALRNPDFAAICREKNIMVEFGNPPSSVTLYNHNKLLAKYEGAIGVKTGFTKKSGRCLVSAAERDGVTLICVTLGVYDYWNMHAQLLDDGFSKLTPHEQPSRLLPDTVPVTGGEAATVGVRQLETPVIPLLPGETEAEERLVLPPFLYAPVLAGQQVGYVQYLLNGVEVARTPVVTTGPVSRLDQPAEHWSLWEWLFGTSEEEQTDSAS